MCLYVCMCVLYVVVCEFGNIATPPFRDCVLALLLKIGRFNKPTLCRGPLLSLLTTLLILSASKAVFKGMAPEDRPILAPGQNMT